MLVLSRTPMQSTLHRIAAWSCLVVALLTGATPVGGFVLCVEADGCVNLEVKASDASCGGCHDHEDGDGSDANHGGLAVEGSSRDGSCPCIDLPLPGLETTRMSPAKAIDFEPSPSLLEPSPLDLSRLLVARGTLLDRAPPPPRAPESLTFLRTIVLCV